MLRNSSFFANNKELVYYGPWNYKRHNNCRYAEILPRLRSVVSRYYTLSRFRILAYVQRHIYRQLIEPWYLYRLSKQYQRLFCTEISQIRLFPGQVIVDTDDPDFQDTDVIDKLNDDRVVAVITTTDLLRSKLLSKGLRHPCHVIPSGVDFRRLNEETALRLQSIYPRTGGNIRLVYAVPKFYLARELFYPHRNLVGGSLRSIDWLLEVMQKVWIDNPNIELWLIGETTKLVRKVCGDEKRFHLLGYIPYDEILPYYSLFDIGLYPRTTDVQGRHSIKLLEYMACGLPIVSTDVSESFRVREANAGIICSDQDEFVDSILELADNADLRTKLGERGHQYAKSFSWGEIAEKYDRVLEEIVNLN